MNLLIRQNPWRVMLAINVAVTAGVFIHKVTLPPYVPSIHLLVDYHFGFVKRTLFDYSRWISNWVVCLFLILHAVKTLPSTQVVPLIAGDDLKTSIFGWIVTLIARVGVVRSF